jgi:hypothetical protein
MASEGSKTGPFSAQEKTLFCPSAQPCLERSVVLGVVQNGGDEPSMKMLDHPVKVTEGTILAFVGNQVRPTRVFRFAAPCEESGCNNWSGCHCRVAERLVQILPVSPGELPKCKLRPVCRWFEEQGQEVCFRCPQVLTDNKGLEAALNATGRTQNSPDFSGSSST